MKDWEYEHFKRKQRGVFAYAVVSGKIRRMPCSVCGMPGAEGHHPDYSKPFEVVWLCYRHHREEHNRLGSFTAWVSVHRALLAELKEGETPNCNAWKHTERTRPRKQAETVPPEREEEESP